MGDSPWGGKESDTTDHTHTHTHMVQRKNWDICLDKDFLDLVSKALFLYKKKK